MGALLALLGPEARAEDVATAAPASAPSADLASQTDPLLLEPYTLALEDPEGRLTLAQVQRDPGLPWEILDKPNLGLTRSTYWAKWTFRNDSDQPLERLLEVRRSAKIKHAELYLLDHGEVVDSWVTGQDHPFETRPVLALELTFPIQVPAGGERTVLLRCQTRGLSLQLQGRLWTPGAFLEEAQTQQAVGWLFYGLTLIMAAYHVILFFAVRDASYLHYVVFLLAACVVDSSAWGFAQQFLSRDDPDLMLRLFPPAGFLLLLGSVLFARDALDLRSHSPRWTRVTNWTACIYAVMAVGNLAFDDAVGVKLFIFTSSPYFIVCITAGVLALRAGNRPARTYLITWGTVFLCVMVQASANLGLLPPSIVTDQAARIGVAFQAVLLSLVLAQRYSQMREKLEREQRDRIEAQEASLVVKEEAAATLQQKVDERTRELSTNMQKIRRLLDSLSEGVFSFGADRILRGNWSVAAERIFQRDQLVQGRVEALLVENMAPWDPERIVLEQWLERAFQVNLGDFDSIAEFAPREIVLHPTTPEEQVLALEFRPVAEEGQLREVMCLVTDVTQLRRAEAEAELRDSEQRRKIAMLRNLSGGGAEMVRFLRDTRVRIDEFEQELQQHRTSMDPACVSTLFQIAHTIKGDSRLHDLEVEEAVAACMEETLEDIRVRLACDGQIDPSPWMEALDSQLSGMRGALAETRDALVEAAPMGEAILDQTTVSTALLHEVLQRSSECRDALTPLLQRLTARPFGETVGRLANAVPAWAERRGKCAVLEVEGRGVAVPGSLAGPLASAITHLVRNAVVHGVEEPEQRRSMGKASRGLVHLGCQVRGQGVEVSVCDDGGGLDAEAVRSRFEATGRSADPAMSVEEMVFEEGLSTASALDAMAGRGVGMAAVKAEMLRVGYEVSLEFTAGQGTRVRIFPAASDRRPDREIDAA